MELAGGAHPGEDALAAAGIAACYPPPDRAPGAVRTLGAVATLDQAEAARHGRLRPGFLVAGPLAARGGARRLRRLVVGRRDPQRDVDLGRGAEASSSSSPAPCCWSSASCSGGSCRPTSAAWPWRSSTRPRSDRPRGDHRDRPRDRRRRDHPGRQRRSTPSWSGASTTSRRSARPRWSSALTVIALSVLAPLGEELLFRGLLLRGLVRRLRFWPAAAISLALFASAHADAYVLWPRAIVALPDGPGAGVALPLAGILGVGDRPRHGEHRGRDRLIASS